MLTLFDHILFALLAVLGPLWGATMGYRRLVRASPTALPRVRRSVYLAAIVMQWSLTAIVIVAWLVTGRAWSLLGVVPVPSWGLAATLFLAMIVIVFIARQRRAVLEDDESLQEVRARMRNVEPMLPRTRGEMRAFLALSLTAGVCEELLYRGYMIFYLTRSTDLLAAAAISSALFGIGHAYQGVRGVLLTGFVGAVFAAVYLVSGSLFVPMLLHVLMDAHSGHLAYRALGRAREIEAEAARETARQAEVARAAAREAEMAREAEVARGAEAARDAEAAPGAEPALESEAAEDEFQSPPPMERPA